VEQRRVREKAVLQLHVLRLYDATVYLFVQDIREWSTSANRYTVPEFSDPEVIRNAIREERMLDIGYRDEQDHESSRRIRPLAIIYYVHAMLLVSWCELRNDFRHFRLDRMLACNESEAWFKGQGAQLREQWKLLESN
jgi:predicted DNA-binding transcriptional regulator YafY